MGGFCAAVKEAFSGGGGGGGGGGGSGNNDSGSTKTNQDRINELYAASDDPWAEHGDELNALVSDRSGTYNAGTTTSTASTTTSSNDDDGPSLSASAQSQVGTVKQDENGDWYAVTQIEGSNALGRDYSIDPQDNNQGPSFGGNVSETVEELFPEEVAAAGGTTDTVTVPFSELVNNALTGKTTDVPSTGYDAGSGTYTPAATQDLDDLSFGEAFAQSRASGADTFEWQGGSYTTDLAPALTDAILSSTNTVNYYDAFGNEYTSQADAAEADNLIAQQATTANEIVGGTEEDLFEQPVLTDESRQYLDSLGDYEFDADEFTDTTTTPATSTSTTDTDFTYVPDLSTKDADLSVGGSPSTVTADDLSGKTVDGKEYTTVDGQTVEVRELGGKHAGTKYYVDLDGKYVGLAPKETVTLPSTGGGSVTLSTDLSNTTYDNLLDTIGQTGDVEGAVDNLLGVNLVDTDTSTSTSTSTTPTSTSTNPRLGYESGTDVVQESADYLTGLDGSGPNTVGGVDDSFYGGPGAAVVPAANMGTTDLGNVIYENVVGSGEVDTPGEELGQFINDLGVSAAAGGLEGPVAGGLEGGALYVDEVIENLKNTFAPVGQYDPYTSYGYTVDPILDLAGYGEGKIDPALATAAATARDTSNAQATAANQVTTASDFVAPAVSGIKGFAEEVSEQMSPAMRERVEKYATADPNTTFKDIFTGNVKSVSGESITTDIPALIVRGGEDLYDVVADVLLGGAAKKGLGLVFASSAAEGAASSNTEAQDRITQAIQNGTVDVQALADKKYGGDTALAEQAMRDAATEISLVTAGPIAGAGDAALALGLGATGIPGLVGKAPGVVQTPVKLAGAGISGGLTEGGEQVATNLAYNVGTGQNTDLAMGVPAQIVQGTIGQGVSAGPSTLASAYNTGTAVDPNTFVPTGETVGQVAQAPSGITSAYEQAADTLTEAGVAGVGDVGTGIPAMKMNEDAIAHPSEGTVTKSAVDLVNNPNPSQEEILSVARENGIIAGPNTGIMPGEVIAELRDRVNNPDLTVIGGEVSTATSMDAMAAQEIINEQVATTGAVDPKVLQNLQDSTGLSMAELGTMVENAGSRVVGTETIAVDTPVATSDALVDEATGIGGGSNIQVNPNSDGTTTLVNTDTGRTAVVDSGEDLANAIQVFDETTTPFDEQTTELTAEAATEINKPNTFISTRGDTEVDTADDTTDDADVAEVVEVDDTVAGPEIKEDTGFDTEQQLDLLLDDDQTQQLNLLDTTDTATEVEVADDTTDDTTDDTATEVEVADDTTDDADIAEVVEVDDTTDDTKTEVEVADDTTDDTKTEVEVADDTTTDTNVTTLITTDQPPEEEDDDEEEEEVVVELEEEEEPGIDVLVPPIITTDEDGNMVTECPDGYAMVQTASGPMCQKSVTSTRQRAGASTRAYTGLSGNRGRSGPGQRRRTTTSTRRVRPTIRSA